MSEIINITITVQKADIRRLIDNFDRDYKCRADWEAWERINNAVENNSQDTHAKACRAAGTNAGINTGVK